MRGENMQKDARQSQADREFCNRHSGLQSRVPLNTDAKRPDIVNGIFILADFFPGSLMSIMIAASPSDPDLSPRCQEKAVAHA